MSIAGTQQRQRGGRDVEIGSDVVAGHTADERRRLEADEVEIALIGIAWREILIPDFEMCKLQQRQDPKGDKQVTC